MNILSWDDKKNLSDSEITYLLYLEGKNIDIISRIRNIQKTEVEKHIIECKIKYRIYENSNSSKDIIEKLKKCIRNERKSIISYLSDKEKIELEKYMLDNLFTSSKEDCCFYIWLLGELKSHKAVQSICAFIKCNDGNVKRICCSALGKIGSIHAEDALISCIKDEKPQVIQYAVKALAKIKSRKALIYLYEIINDKKQRDYVKKSAEYAINEILKGDTIE